MSRVFRPATLAFAAALLAFGGTAAAQTAATTTARPADAASGALAPSTRTAAPKSSAASAAELPRAERKFVEEAAQGGMAEVQLGQMARQRGASAQVKQFGNRMVQDHGKANEELKGLVANKGVQLPTTLSRSHQRDMDRMAKLSGAEFDRAYMKHMVGDHKKDVSSSQKQARSGQGVDLKAFAAKTLPTLQEHLREAQTIDAAVSKTR